MGDSITDYYFSFQELIALQGKIREPSLFTNPALDGIIYREQDFTRSHSELNAQFASEYMIATKGFATITETTELMNYVSDQLHVHDSGRVYALGENHFSSDSLAPALRHFLNDSCRLLEPFAPFMSKLTGSVKVTNKNSFGSYVNAAATAGNKSFDAAYILELYELWNDYKHRNTGGLGLTGWGRATPGVSLPKLLLPHDNFKLLNNMTVSDFTVITTAKVHELIGLLA